MLMGYKEYLQKTNLQDTRQNWIAWKIDICGMEPVEATKAAYDPEWGYSELEG